MPGLSTAAMALPQGARCLAVVLQQPQVRVGGGMRKLNSAEALLRLLCDADILKQMLFFKHSYTYQSRRGDFPPSVQHCVEFSESVLQELVRDWAVIYELERLRAAQLAFVSEILFLQHIGSKLPHGFSSQRKPCKIFASKAWFILWHQGDGKMDNTMEPSILKPVRFLWAE